MMTGNMVSNEAAMSRFQLVLASPWNKRNPRANVKFSDECR